MKKLNKKTSLENTVSDVDKDRLDEEWNRHPKLVEDYAIRSANANDRYLRAKAELDLLEADLSLYFRTNFEAVTGGKLKMTENVIDSLILQDKKHQEAAEKVLTAKHKLDLLDAVMRALEHRKKALENLVVLHGRDYYSSPVVTNSVEGEMFELEQKKKVRAKGRKEES